MKKFFIYLSGVVLVAFSIALNYKCGFGSSSIDSLTKNIADSVNLGRDMQIISVGNVLTILSLLFVLVYFIFLRSKDIYIPIIVSFLLGLLIDGFIFILNFELANLTVKIILFVIALNLMNIGVAFLVISGLSPTPYECLTKLVYGKIFKKVSYGFAKIIVEIIVVAISIGIGLIFLNSLGEVSWATGVMVICNGPLINLYLRLFNKISFLRVEVKG